MHFFKALEHLIREYAHEVPLEWFVLLGSFAEEVISPIPSALIMGTAGSIALMQGAVPGYLVFLVLLGNIGKTFGSWIYYFLGDRLEDLLIGRITKFFGVKHEEIENIGKRFTGHHWKDGGILFILRAMPFVPTTPVSIAAGIIKMDKRIFLLATYAGNVMKDLVYIYAGYAGLAKLQTLWREIIPVKAGIDILVAIGIIAFLVFLYIHRGRGKELLARCANHLTKK